MLLDLATIFINNIAPIFIIAGIGYWVGQYLSLDPKPFGGLIFYVLSPALVFTSLYTSEVSGGEFVSLIGGVVVYYLIMFALSAWAMRVQGATSIQRANIMIGAATMNAGNYGLSLIRFAFDDVVFSRAVIVLIGSVIMNYSMDVFIASNGRGTVREALMNVLRTPSIYAVIAAFAIRAFDWLTLPLPVDRSIMLLGEASIPMMLIMLGIQLGQFTKPKHLRLIASSVVLKLLIAPLVALALSLLFGIDGAGRIAFVVQAGMPTAVLTLILATQFDLDRDLALNIILVSTFLSPLTLSVLILLFQSG